MTRRENVILLIPPHVNQLLHDLIIDLLLLVMYNSCITQNRKALFTMVLLSSRIYRLAVYKTYGTTNLAVLFLCENRCWLGVRYCWTNGRLPHYYFKHHGDLFTSLR